jgi:hypothetical protein
MVEPAYDSRDRIVGHYDAEEYSESYNEWIYYSIYISKSSFRERVYLDNFYGSNIRIYALVDYDRITIPYQVVGGYEVEGVGTFNGNYLSLSYRVKDIYNNSYSDFCETEARR